MFCFYLGLVISGNKKAHSERVFQLLFQGAWRGLGRKATCETNQGLKIHSLVLRLSEEFIVTAVS